MRRTPKISTVKPAALGQNLDLAVSGKNVFQGGKNDMFSSNKNEFTFSPSHHFEGPTKDGPVTFKKATPKNPFEKNLLQDRNPNESLSKNEIFDRLGIKNPEAEQVADLSMHSLVMGAGSSMPKSKKEVTNNLIANLETEIEKLKYKRDNYIADKEKERRERLLNARKLPDQDEETNIILHRDEERMQQVLHPISSLEKPTLENVEALLRAHKEKMSQLERSYMERKKHQMLNSDFDYEPTGAESVKNAPIKSINVPEEFRKGKENYGNERPKSSNPYMSQKEYEKKKREAEALKMQKRKEDARNYKEKFNEYIYDKRDYLEYQDEEKAKNAAAGKPAVVSTNKDFDRYQPTSPNPKRSKSRNKWDAESIVEKDEMAKRSRSPQRERHHSPQERERPLTAKSEKSKRASRFGEHSPGKSPSRERVRSSSPLRKSVRIKDTNAEHADISEQEVKLLHFVFNMMRKNGQETVDKEDICDYILRSPEILELYEIDATNLRNNLYTFATKDRDTVFFEEFLSFLENSRAGNIERLNTDMNQSGGFRRSASKNRKSGVRFSPERKSTKASKVENGCMLSDETLDTIREVFNEVDKHEDLIVKRQALVKRLREDVRIMRILHKPAVHIVEIDKYLTMERLLRQIEEEETNAIGEQKRAKEYISLNQFLKYFTNYETPDDLAEKMGEFQKTQSTKKSPSRSTRGFEEDDQDIIEVANKHMQFFQQIFDTQPKKRQAFAETMSFVDSIRGDDRYVLCRRDPARRKAQHFDLEAENIEQTLNRLEMEAEKYISWDDFIQYFTRRGRPKRLLTTTYNVEQDLIQSGLASNPKDQAAQTGSKIVQNRPRDGYDSDPEFHTYNKQINYEFKLNRSPHQGEIQEEMRSSKERSPQKRTRGEFSPQRSVGVGNEFDQHNQTWTERPTRTEGPDNEGWVERRGRSTRKTEGNEEFDYNPRFGAVFKDPRGLKYTVPDPFEFDTREKVRAKSIRERKVEEMVQEKIDEEERILNHRFRANSVPGIVKTPLFEKIIHDQEQRRAQVKKNSVAITKMREAPFNFYLRDKDKPPKPEYQLNDEFGKRFKAKPIPAICQLTDVWVNMKEREDIERKERVARLAQQNLLLASLPPRMAKHEKEKKEQELRNQINEKNMERQQDRKTFVANEVPNFERLHKQFQDLLDRKRSNKRPTESRPFAFQESKKGVMRNYLDVENQYKKAAKDETRRDPFESVRKLKSIKPKMQPHTTKKMIALSDLRKKEREEKQRKAEQLEKEDEARKERYHKMKPLVQGSSAIADNKAEKEKRSKQIKEEVKNTFIQNQRNFEDKKRAIDENVAKRPLLVEQVTGKSQKQQLQAMHDLNKLNKIMKEAGVRDPKTYFSQDERDKIEDAEYLEKRGFKNFNKSDE